jgi:hypothetical protein
MRRLLSALALPVLVLGVVVGTDAGEAVNAADAALKAPIRCPAAGSLEAEATSDAPPKLSEEMLAFIRASVDEVAAHSPELWAGVGTGRDSVFVMLVPGQERLAARLVERFGGAVRVQVGLINNSPRGCEKPVDRPHCPALTGDAPKTAGVRLTVLVDTPTIRVSDHGEARLRVENVGTTDFAIDSGIPLVGSLVEPGTTEVVGTHSGVIAGVGGGVRLAPGQSGTIEMVLGAARCARKSRSAVPPGRYGLRVVLEPEGREPGPRLRSPAAAVTVTR